MLITRQFGADRAIAHDDALRALLERDWTRERGGLLAYFPVNVGNPFQALLYSGLDAANLTPIPTHDPQTTKQVALALEGSGLDLVVHLHWLNVVMAKAKDEAEAREASKRYLGQLDDLRERGARLLWTVHNILPHEARFTDLEVELRKAVVERAERVHVMSERTKELVAPWFDIPDHKLMPVPHPSYLGVYPTWMPRAQARQQLGLSPDTIVFLLVGRVKPYKGLTELLDAFDTLSEREPGRYELLVAGPPGHEDETKAFKDRLLTHPTAHGALRKLSDQEMQVFCKAADVAVFPYRRSLNSGALSLALTFGLPVIVRDDGGEGARIESSYGILYGGEDPDGLVAALADARRLLTPEARASAAEAAERHAPARVSGDFASAVRHWLDSERAL